MHRIKQLIHEVHRRSLWQVLAIYSLGSWAAYQVIAELTTRLALPDWVPGFSIVLFLIGLPIVLATAVVQEGLPGRTPLGIPEDPTLMPDFDTVDERRLNPPSLLTPARPHFFLTWQRSVLAGITAFLLLGVTAGGYIGLREAGVAPFATLLTSGALEQRDRLIVAQLTHTGGDTIVAAALTEALRVDLAQSPVVSVVESRFIGDALQRMGRTRQEQLNGELAREIAIREGVKAVLEGEIAPAGGGYIITARLLRANGELLVSHRETAVAETELIDAMDRLSRKMREKIGESLRTIRADPPLAQVTTASLPALQKFTAAAAAIDRQTDYDRGIPLLKEAIADDSSFAMAWRKLAVAYYNTRGGRDRMTQAATKAHELRDRLTERERYHTIAFYQLNVAGDQTAAIQAYRSILELYPDDRVALNNIALVYGRLRDNEKAAEYYGRAIAVDSLAATAYANLALTQYELGRTEDARRTLADYRLRFPQARDGVAFTAELAHSEARYDEAEQLLRSLIDEGRTSDTWRTRANFMFANHLLIHGQVAQALRHFEEGVSTQVAQGNRAVKLFAARGEAEIDRTLRQQPDAAVRRLDALVASELWRNVPPIARPMLQVAQTYARSGRADRARAVFVEREALRQDELFDPPFIVEYTRGWIALAEERMQDAIAHMRTAAETDECLRCGHAPLAAAYDAAQMPDSAIAAYRRFIDIPSLTRLEADAMQLAPAYERLAELYEAAADRDNAARYATLFVNLWKNADPQLQPRVRLKHDMLARLQKR